MSIERGFMEKILEEMKTKDVVVRHVELSTCICFRYYETW